VQATSTTTFIQTAADQPNGCAHLVGLHPALGPTERDDLQRILTAVGQSRTLAQALGQKLISPGQ